MATFIVSDIVGREVVYSTRCIENAYKFEENTQTFLEVVKLPEPMLMAPGDSKKAIECIDASLDIVNGSLLIAAVLTPPPANLVLGALAGVGALIQAGLGFFGDSPDPVEEKLKLLKQKVSELDEKTKQHFADLKSFITEHQFSIEIVSEVSSLKKYMSDCLEFFNEDAIENFRAAYEHNSPLNIGYILYSLLSQKTTNPIVMALEREGIDKEAEIKKWEKIIQTIVGDLIWLEAFGAGLLKNSESHDYDRLWALSKEIADIVIQCKNAYQWEKFANGFEKYIESHTHFDNATKAEDIKNQLEKNFKGDSFIICVLNRATSGEDFFCYAANPDSQLVEVRNKGLCNAFVYRSIQGKKMKHVDYDKLKNQVFATRTDTFEKKLSLRGQVKDLLLPQKLVRDDGLVALVYKCDPTIKWANSENGPGIWTDACGKNEWYYYKIVVGFP
ncbi:hypothetical protein CAEBREN_01053 [Caenorhabditis brenneri]|uniref:Uncharacterized protein n=1 Tax=Caenorhabditis brenneri TaxID=135651 RepID=G0P049_CAEBE|nr:hypothetical protein CAEBREN_01053 [Caenorhabditis brenneri]